MDWPSRLGEPEHWYEWVALGAACWALALLAYVAFWQVVDAIGRSTP